MKFLKLYEDFEWDEDDFDFEEEEFTLRDKSKTHDGINIIIRNKEDWDKFVDYNNKEGLDIFWKSTNEVPTKKQYRDNMMYLNIRNRNLVFIHQENGIVHRSYSKTKFYPIDDLINDVRKKPSRLSKFKKWFKKENVDLASFDEDDWDYEEFDETNLYNKIKRIILEINEQLGIRKNDITDFYGMMDFCVDYVKRKIDKYPNFEELVYEAYRHWGTETLKKISDDLFKNENKDIDPFDEEDWDEEEFSGHNYYIGKISIDHIEVFPCNIEEYGEVLRYPDNHLIQYITSVGKEMLDDDNCFINYPHLVRTNELLYYYTNNSDPTYVKKRLKIMTNRLNKDLGDRLINIIDRNDEVVYFGDNWMNVNLI